jgi:hypothetical protein
MELPPPAAAREALAQHQQTVAQERRQEPFGGSPNVRRMRMPPKKIAITARMTVTRARRHYHKWKTGTGQPGTNYEQSFNDDIRTFGRLATASAQPPDPDLDPLRRLCQHVYDEWVQQHVFDSPSCTDINRVANHYIRQHP